MVVVPALVRTHAGALVYTLQADDFKLTDDGVPQALTLEHETGGEPLALVVLVEIGAKMATLERICYVGENGATPLSVQS